MFHPAAEPAFNNINFSTFYYITTTFLYSYLEWYCKLQARSGEVRIPLPTWTGWRNTGISSISSFLWKFWHLRGWLTCTLSSWLTETMKHGAKTRSSSSCRVKVFLQYDKLNTNRKLKWPELADLSMMVSFQKHKSTFMTYKSRLPCSATNISSMSRYRKAGSRLSCAHPLSRMAPGLEAVKADNSNSNDIWTRCRSVQYLFWSSIQWCLKRHPKSSTLMSGLGFFSTDSSYSFRNGVEMSYPTSSASLS